MFKSYQLRQDWNQDLPKYWNDGSPFMTHIMNAMSITFPDGERFFIDSVKYYKDRITDPQLQQEVAEFVKQEIWHGHAHNEYNKWLTSKDINVNQPLHLKLLAWMCSKSPKSQLATTVCLEHITATVSSNTLRNRTFYRNMHEHFGQIWFWHAIEEVEHKAVTMDVWDSIFSSRKGLRTTMVIATIVFWYNLLTTTCRLLRADKQLWKWRTLTDAWYFLFDKNGMIRGPFKLWLNFFRKDFHPNDHDDTLLLKYRKG